MSSREKQNVFLLESLTVTGKLFSCLLTVDVSGFNCLSLLVYFMHLHTISFPEI